jgi:hypothetical protein
VCAQAAWVWVYGGERHVVMPPEEGQPAWAAYPDADGDGRPDPIITKVDLRIQNDAGEPIARTRLGREIRLVATPELGGMELDRLVVRFRLAGPGGDLPLTLDEPLREPTVVGTAPPVYAARCVLPPPPGREFAGDYQASVRVELQGVVLDTRDSPVPLRILGPRETMPERIGRKVRGPLRQAGRGVRELGEKVAGEVEAWLAEQKPQPGHLHDVQRRQTLGMLDRVLQAPGSPIKAVEGDLGLPRAAALRSLKPPEHSVLVVPFDRAQALEADRWYPMGFVVLNGLRPPGITDLSTVLPWSCEGCIRAGRLVLEAQPGDVEGRIHLEAADGHHFVSAPARLEWFNRLPFPREVELHMRTQPAADRGGLVETHIDSAVPGGAVRAEFDLPVVSTAPPPA